MEYQHSDFYETQVNNNLALQPEFERIHVIYTCWKMINYIFDVFRDVEEHD